MTPQHQSQEALEHSLAEKELLLKEIHHRVKNNLQVICSLLRLQASYLDDGYAKWMFRNSEERVKCMALVHERLYRSGSMSRVNFRGYVEELVVELMRTYALEPSAIELVLDLEDIELSIDRAVPCGLIVNELVTNALKHAYASGRHGKLAISLRQVDSLVRLSVADDGPGLSEEIDLDDAKTLGLRVVHTLGMQLGADVSIGRRFGTRFDVTFESERKRPQEWR
jgi:two-component sensor histidine kinase